MKYDRVAFFAEKVENINRALLLTHQSNRSVSRQGDNNHPSRLLSRYPVPLSVPPAPRAPLPHAAGEAVFSLRQPFETTEPPVPPVRGGAFGSSCLPPASQRIGRYPPARSRNSAARRFSHSGLSLLLGFLPSSFQCFLSVIERSVLFPLPAQGLLSPCRPGLRLS